MSTSIHMNVFRILGDLSHLSSKCILLYSIHRNRSAEGVSLLTQLLYMLVFLTRYLDLFWVPPFYSWWNTIFKIFYISSSAYIVWLMMRVYARTREKEAAWKLATGSLAACLISSPIVCLIFRQWSGTTFVEILWVFSVELESVCVLPQLLLLRQTTVPTVIDSYYLLTLGSYRFFYILNWAERSVKESSHAFPIRVIFGVLQTLLYIDFAWVYWSRQRVKLRGGGIVDGDDLRKSFLVRRFIGNNNRAGADDDDEGGDEEAGLQGQENGTIRSGGQQPRSWGARGISVSADDTLHDHQQRAEDGGGVGGYADTTAAQDAQMIDPAHFEDVEEDLVDDDEDVDAPPPPVAKDNKFGGSETSGSKGHGEDSSTTAWAENTGEERSGS